MGRVCFVSAVACSFLTAVVALSLGLGLSLSHLSDFLDPPHCAYFGAIYRSASSRFVRYA